MKIKFCCDNGANIHSKKCVTFDLEKDLFLTEEEWQNMAEDDKFKMVEEWTLEQLDFWFEEVQK
jgi:hypothetical protein